MRALVRISNDGNSIAINSPTCHEGRRKISGYNLREHLRHITSLTLATKTLRDPKPYPIGTYCQIPYRS